MKKIPNETKVYHVSPARRWIMVWIFAPTILIFGTILFSDEPGAGVILLLIVLPIALAGHWLVSYARLELSSDGVYLRPIACPMQTTWNNIRHVTLDRGREGLVTRQPMTGKGVDRFRALRNFRMGGTETYDEVQRAGLAAGRFMPIEAFAYWIRKGTMIDDIEQWAPDLAASIRRELEPAEEAG